MDADEVSREMVDLPKVFGAVNGKGEDNEAVFAGILGGAGPALRRAGVGRLRAVGALGCDLLWSNRMRHGNTPLL